MIDRADKKNVIEITTDLKHLKCSKTLLQQIPYSPPFFSPLTKNLSSSPLYMASPLYMGSLLHPYFMERRIVKLLKLL
jgi:hypothetical protein